MAERPTAAAQTATRHDPAPPGAPGAAEDGAPRGEFERLHRYVRLHLGSFALGLVRVNDPRQRDGVLASLAEALAREGVGLVVVNLSNRHFPNLRSALADNPAVQAALAQPQTAALAITGMEHLIEEEVEGRERPPFGAALNQERDALPGLLPLPLLLCLTDHAMDRLDLVAPDFFDWYSGVFWIRPAQGAATPAGDSLPPDVAARLEEMEQRRAELARQGKAARLELGRTLAAIGALYADLPEFHYRQAAIPPLKEACALFHAIGAVGDEAKNLEQLGTVCYWINDYRQAKRRYLAALQVYRAIGNRMGEANCTRSLGDVHRMEANYSEAQDLYKESFSIYHSMNDSLGEANCLHSLGYVHTQLDEYTKAMALYKQALPIYRKFGDRLGEANCIQGLGDVHVQCNEYSQARVCYAEALSIYRSIGVSGGEVNCINGLGYIYTQHSEYSLAQAYYEEALLIYRKIGDRLGKANCLRSLGDVYLLSAKSTQAQVYYEEALSIFRNIKHPLGEATCICSLGNVHRRRAEYGEAKSRYEEAISIYRNIGNRLGEANCIQGLGDMYMQQARYADSQACFSEALSLCQDIGNRLGEANCIVELARLLGDEGRFRDAIAIYADIGAGHSLARAHYYFGLWLRGRQRSSESLTALGAAEELWRQVKLDSNADMAGQEIARTQALAGDVKQS